jgi:hypothetical protein
VERFSSGPFHSKLNFEEEALFQFFQAQSGMNESLLQFKHVLKMENLWNFQPKLKYQNAEVPCI